MSLMRLNVKLFAEEFENPDALSGQERLDIVPVSFWYDSLTKKTCIRVNDRPLLAFSPLEISHAIQSVQNHVWFDDQEERKNNEEIEDTLKEDTLKVVAHCTNCDHEEVISEIKV